MAIVHCSSHPSLYSNYLFSLLIVQDVGCAYMYPGLRVKMHDIKEMEYRCQHGEHGKSILAMMIIHRFMPYRFSNPLQIAKETYMGKLERLKDNLDWFNENYKHFKKYNRNQFVAIKDKSFLDKDTELERLVKRLDIKDLDDSIAIEFVHG
jgi:hypothetical protein